MAGEDKPQEPAADEKPVPIGRLPERRPALALVTVEEHAEPRAGIGWACPPHLTAARDQHGDEGRDSSLIPVHVHDPRLAHRTGTTVDGRLKRCCLASLAGARSLPVS